MSKEKSKDTGRWKPYDEKYANDRFMITHTGYLVDTELDEVYLTIQAFLNFVNKELGVKLSDDEKRYYHDAYYYRREYENSNCIINQYKEMIKELQNENEQLKQQIKDLYKFVKYDVDNEIDVYPKSILEHLVNILKIIGDVECY